jgi:hypothetical protein
VKLLPQGKWQRLGAWVAIWAVYGAVMWFWIFPWIDSTFVSNPSFEDQPQTVVPTLTSTPTPSGSVVRTP